MFRPAARFIRKIACCFSAKAPARPIEPWHAAAKRLIEAERFQQALALFKAHGFSKVPPELAALVLASPNPQNPKAMAILNGYGSSVQDARSQERLASLALAQGLDGVAALIISEAGLRPMQPNRHFGGAPWIGAALACGAKASCARLLANGGMEQSSPQACAACLLASFAWIARSGSGCVEFNDALDALASQAFSNGNFTLGAGVERMLCSLLEALPPSGGKTSKSSDPDGEALCFCKGSSGLFEALEAIGKGTPEFEIILSRFEQNLLRSEAQARKESSESSRSGWL